MHEETKAQRGYLPKIMELVSGKQKGIREVQVQLKSSKNKTKGIFNLVVW